VPGGEGLDIAGKPVPRQAVELAYFLEDLIGQGSHLGPGPDVGSPASLGALDRLIELGDRIGQVLRRGLDQPGSRQQLEAF
jgi:hypothetical protein